jgi:hypothetical protein
MTIIEQKKEIVDKFNSLVEGGLIIGCSKKDNFEDVYRELKKESRKQGDYSRIKEQEGEKQKEIKDFILPNMDESFFYEGVRTRIESRKQILELHLKAKKIKKLYKR